MKGIVLPLLFGFAACSSGRYKPAEPGKNVEGQAPVTIHPEIEDKVSVVGHTSARTDDGRLYVRVTLASESKADRALIVRTHWLDESRNTVAMSDWRHVYLPGGTTVLYESTSLDARPVGYSVAVRPASTDRRR
jgi:hypothetical protein